MPFYDRDPFENEERSREMAMEVSNAIGKG